MFCWIEVGLDMRSLSRTRVRKRFGERDVSRFELDPRASARSGASSPNLDQCSVRRWARIQMLCWCSGSRIAEVTMLKMILYRRGNCKLEPRQVSALRQVLRTNVYVIHQAFAEGHKVMFRLVIGKRRDGNRCSHPLPHPPP